MDKNYNTSVSGSALQARGPHRVETTKQQFGGLTESYSYVLKPQFTYGFVKIYGDSTMQVENGELQNEGEQIVCLDDDGTAEQVI